MTMAEVSAYEYAIIVSRSVQAKVSCLLCTLSDYIFILTWVFLCLVYLQGYPTPQSVDEQKWIPAFFVCGSYMLNSYSCLWLQTDKLFMKKLYNFYSLHLY